MLPFVPRKVAQKAVKTQVQPPRSQHTDDATRPEQIAGPSGVASSSNVVPEANTQNLATASLKGKGRETNASKPLLSADAFASLLCLSLSDHALWLDASLRRTLETSEEGYIPLKHLLHHSSYLSSLSPPPSEAVLVKAIREHASEVFGIRVLFSSPSRAVWYGRAAGTGDDVGGYEIRLKDWDDALKRIRDPSREDWEKRTVYMENIPLQYRSIPGIYQFTASILSTSTRSGSSRQVQSISLPRHHQDQSTDQPKCKGFALVTLATTELAERLAEEWSWGRDISSAKPGAKEDFDIHDAARFGFRVLRKARWDRLKEEYQARRVQLLQQVAETSSRRVAFHGAEEDENELDEPPPPNIPKRKRTPAPVEPEMPTKPVTTLSSPYPSGCLVFVKNVHLETNKTTLKTLFSRAFPDRLSAGAIDYVDYNKGMDSCHLRLATSEHASQLYTHFTENSTVQSTGLDNSGVPAGDKGRHIVVELVTGTREELYWDKVPEKVRRQAVQKAVFASATLPGAETTNVNSELEGGDGGQRQRKRKKKGE